MRFLVDECTGPRVADWLRREGHEVYSVFHEARGADDQSICQKAYEESWIIITNDSDFGTHIFKNQRPHRGVVFLRLRDERSANKIAVLARLLSDYSTKLANQFVVVTEDQIRFSEK